MAWTAKDDAHAAAVTDCDCGELSACSSWLLVPQAYAVPICDTPGSQAISRSAGHEDDC